MKILQGDCLEKMAELEDNSIDTIITDPPYGLSFMGKKWDYDVPSIEIWKECLRVLKPGGTALIFAGSRTQHRMAVNVEDAGFILKDCIMWLYGSGFPKATDISKQLDKGVERRVVGRQKALGNAKEKGAGGHYANSINSVVGDKEIVKDGWDITEPATPEAKLWNGWKSHGLKPAYEPILVAVKPNDGTYANNALKWGVSGLNIDGGRIETEEEIGRDNTGIKGSILEPKDGWNNNSMVGLDTRGKQSGRFPANILLDEEAAKMLDEQSGQVGGDTRKSKSTYDKGIWGNAKPVESQALYNDKGGASRFFYVAKASKSERNAGCEELDKKFRAGLAGADRDIPEKLDDVSERFRTQPAQNNHPTVKPLKLMEYLCTLTKTPTGGVCLDPFAGSGTTGLACQNTGRDYILIEREEEYIPIIKARLN